MIRPLLLRRDAINTAPSTVYVTKQSAVHSAHFLDFDVLETYIGNKYTYKKRNVHHVINGYMRRIIDHLFRAISDSPQSINALIFQYYFQSNIARFHVSYSLWLSNLHKLSDATSMDPALWPLLRESLHLQSNDHETATDSDDDLTVRILRSKKGFTFHARNLIHFQEYYKYLKNRDRDAWRVGSVVYVKSTTYRQRWMLSTIISIKADRIAVVFGERGGKFIKKYLNRFDYANIKSTPQFVDSRKKLSAGASVRIYNHFQETWFDGHIKRVVIRDINRCYDDEFEIEYCSAGRCRNTLTMSRWSPDLALVHEPRVRVGIGSQCCRVWSKSQRRWVSATIKMVIPTCNCVLVKYAKSQKVVDVACVDWTH